MNEKYTDTTIETGFRFIETVRNLDERIALKMALALAGIEPELFTQIYNVVKLQNLVPPSTYILDPVPATVEK